jgi:hypothetical protein
MLIVNAGNLDRHFSLCFTKIVIFKTRGEHLKSSIAFALIGAVKVVQLVYPSVSAS